MPDEAEQLRATIRAMREMISHLHGVMIGLYDLDGVCELLLGVPSISGVAASEGKHYDTFLPPDRRDRFVWLFERALRGHTTTSDYPIGQKMYDAIVRPIRDEVGSIRHIMFYVRDVTHEREAATALAQKGARDSLTGLPKRSVLQAFVTNLIASQRPFHVLFLDLDRFKLVNDIFGHKAGDILLANVSQAVQNTIRSGDLVVRLGGDEFVVVLAETRDVNLPMSRIKDAILKVTESYGAGVSIGAATFPESGTTLELLIEAADLAMYTAKRIKSP